MAEILNYIARQINNLTDTISDNDTLKSVGLYEIVNFIAENPDKINGGRIRYWNTGGPIDSREALVSAEYGISLDFLQKVRDEAKKQPPKEQSAYFRNTIYRSAKSDKDIKDALTKLYNYSSFDKLAKAMVNTINYAVLNTQYASIINYSKLNGVGKFTNNITFEDLPYGKLSPIPASSSSKIKEPLLINTDNLYTLCLNLAPIDYNFTTIDVNSSLRFFRCVANETEQYVRFTFPNSSATAFLKNDRLAFNLTNNLSGQDLSCKPLSIESKTDNTALVSTFFEKSNAFRDATKYELLASTNQPDGCSSQELQKIQQDLDFVKSLDDNTDFVKIEGVAGKDLLNQVIAFSEISKSFSDVDFGQNAISLKVFFDKKDDVFASVNSIDLFLAVFGASYGFGDDVLVNFYFNPKTEDIYVVNQNQEQFGYCKGLESGLMSNCEYVMYAQLLQPSLSDMAKYNLMVDENILPVMLDEGVVRETTGLRDALNRQNYLLALQDDDLFFQLFLRNIASYVYSYAKQVEQKRKFFETDDDGKTKEVERTQIVWKPIENPKWSDNYNPSTNSTTDKWFYDKQLKAERWSNPNYYYIYDVRETFWHINSDLSFKELLAFFVSKSGNSPNIAKYRELSQRILGVDYYLFAKKLIPSLLDEGVLCIEVLDYEKTTNVLKKVKFSPAFEYVSGDVYSKLYKLDGQLGENIKMLYGEVKGSEYIANQTTLLNNSKPKQITFGNQIQELNLKLNIHNPILFNDSEGYVGRVGKATKTLNNGKVVISTYEQGDSTRYKKLEFENTSMGNTMKKNYEDWAKETGMSYNHHLAQFEAWILFGRGRSSIGKDYITPRSIIDGYVYPKPRELFVPKYIMPTFADKAKKGQASKIPLSFLPKEVASKSVGKFTFSSIYNESRLGDSLGNSYLTQSSRENLISAGIISKKQKIKYTYNDSVGNAQTITLTPITKDEGKEIFSILVQLYNKLEGEIKLEGDSLFTIFCQQQMTPEYRKEIEVLWNATYNNLAIPKYPKFPVFCEHSRWFGKLIRPFLFNLREAQIEGMKFSVSGQNSGLLAHEVGFGKTTTSIALISHLNLTGESSRNIVFTPNQVYDKFEDEITGNIKTQKLGLLGNWKQPYNVIRMGNALPKVLLGPTKNGIPIDKTGLKTYAPKELVILEKSKTISDLAKKTFNEDMQMKQARFFTELSFPEFANIDSRVNQSDATEWFDLFRGNLDIEIPEIDDYFEEVDRLLGKIESEINRNTRELSLRMNEMRVPGKKTSNLYSFQDFKPDRIKSLPNYVQKWWRQARATAQSTGGKISKYAYPKKYWVSDIDDAVEIGAVTPQQENDIRTNILGVGQKWNGTLTPAGLKEMLKLDEKLSNAFYSRGGRGPQNVIRMLNAIPDMLVDELGAYKKRVYEPNTIVLCSYDTSGSSIRRFRVSNKSRNEAQMYVSNVDDKRYVTDSVKRAFDELEFRPLSLMRLNITGIVVDEIHNFNNLIGRPRPHTLSYISEYRSGKTEESKNLHLLPTQKASANLSSLPDGNNLNAGNGLGDDSAYQISYNSGGKGGLNLAPTNLMSIIFEIQNNPLNKDMNVKNSVVMSATPFTDNVFQMFSVFGLTNRDRLKECHLDKVFNFFITFVKEEWRFNITHKSTFGLFAEIQGYYNTFAMSNFIKAMANFKVSDVDIEKSRPVKYIVPQEKGLDNQSGSNTSSNNYSKYLEDVESYITLTDVQREMIEKIAGFVQGTEDNPYVICPNWKDAVQVTPEGLSITDPEIKEEWEEYQDLMAKVKSDAQNRQDYLTDAFKIIDRLREKFPKIAEIDKQWNKVDKLLFSTDDEEKEKELEDMVTDWENIGVMSFDEEQVFSARAILGQSYGQRLVLSPYLLSCDKTGNLPNSLLKPLDKNDLSLSAKNFIEASPKLKYAVDCAIESIKYDSDNSANNYFIGGQIIYLNKGVSFKYGGDSFNAFELVKKYIIDQKVSYLDRTGEKPKRVYLESKDIDIITGGMNKQVNMEQIDPKGRITFKYDKQGNIRKQTKREEIRDKFNDGRCKILIGSVAIREGIDLQERAHTLYITDSDFSPSNAMQLEGRIWRQGNAWENVRIVYVLGRDSIDAFVYSKLQQKIGEIKKMLEAGVYELNKTQFTINAKDRIKKIISDLDKLSELEWQDEQDNLKLERAKFSQEEAKLLDIQDNYSKYKVAFDGYVENINKLYQVVINDEIYHKAKELKQKLDIVRERKYSAENKEKSSAYRKQNPYKPLTMIEAIDELNERIRNKQDKLSVPNITLRKNSKMSVVNVAVESVRKLLINQKQPLTNLLGLNDNERLIHINKPDADKSTAERIFTALVEIKTKFYVFDQVLEYVSEFAQGTAKEGLLNDYSYLVSNKVKKKNGVEVLKNGKKVYCNMSDIDDLLTDVENRLSAISKELNSEQEYKNSIKKVIKKSQEESKKIVGATLEQQITNFQKSRPLIQIRKKS